MLSLTGATTSKFKALPEISVMGYYEQSYDKNGNVIGQTGEIAVAAKWEGKAQRLCL